MRGVRGLRRLIRWLGPHLCGKERGKDGHPLPQLPHIVSPTTRLDSFDRDHVTAWSVHPQSKSFTVVSMVTRVAETTPTMWAVVFPEVSVAFKINVPV